MAAHRKSRPTRGSRLEYYAYVSDSKVDMLFAQIPRDLRARLIAELKVDVKVVSVSLRESPGDDTRYSKLEVVRSYLARHSLVGSVSAPLEYFGGVLDLRWGSFGGDYGESSDMVFFGGRTNDTILGLGGSMRHVIGVGGDSHAHAYSATPALYHALSDYVTLTRPDGRGRLGPCDSAEAADEIWAWAVALATREQRGALESFDFIARTVNSKYEPRAESRVLLGSPLFVRYSPAGSQSPG